MPSHLTIYHSSGTETVIGDRWAVTTIPGLPAIHAHPTPDQHETALDLGYPDAGAMTRDHDPCHAWLCDELGLSASIALTQTAGGNVDTELAALEEVAVMALQKFMRRAGVTPPWLR